MIKNVIHKGLHVGWPSCYTKWNDSPCISCCLQLFNTTIQTSEKSDQLPERLKICLRETTMTIYNNVAR